MTTRIPSDIRAQLELLMMEAFTNSLTTTTATTIESPVLLEPPVASSPKAADPLYTLVFSLLITLILGFLFNSNSAIPIFLGFFADVVYAVFSTISDISDLHNELLSDPPLFATNSTIYLIYAFLYLYVFSPPLTTLIYKSTYETVKWLLARTNAYSQLSHKFTTVYQSLKHDMATATDEYQALYQAQYNEAGKDPKNPLSATDLDHTHLQSLLDAKDKEIAALKAKNTNQINNIQGFNEYIEELNLEQASKLEKLREQIIDTENERYHLGKKLIPYLASHRAHFDTLTYELPEKYITVSKGRLYYDLCNAENRLEAGLELHGKTKSKLETEEKLHGKAKKSLTNLRARIAEVVAAKKARPLTSEEELRIEIERLVEEIEILESEKEILASEKKKQEDKIDQLGIAVGSLGFDNVLVRAQLQALQKKVEMKGRKEEQAVMDLQVTIAAREILPVNPRKRK